MNDNKEKGEKIVIIKKDATSETPGGGLGVKAPGSARLSALIITRGRRLGWNAFRTEERAEQPRGSKNI